MEELQWHLYAIGFLLGLGYAVDLDGHVRVDVVAEHWSPRRRAWIEFFGLLLFVVPFIWIVVANAIPFVQRAYLAERGLGGAGRSALPLGDQGGDHHRLRLSRAGGAVALPASLRLSLRRARAPPPDRHRAPPARFHGQESPCPSTKSRHRDDGRPSSRSFSRAFPSPGSWRASSILFSTIAVLGYEYLGWDTFFLTSLGRLHRSGSSASTPRCRTGSWSRCRCSSSWA